MWLRRNLIRVISARDMHWKEREAYLSILKKPLPKSRNDAAERNQRDVPYQSLLKVFLAERIDRERKQKNGSGRS